MAEVTGLRNNALNYPIYGVPFGIVAPILDADGDLVSGATGLDSEVSLNGDTFTDCTNEATEIATSSGIYYLLLTAAEMTADVVTVQIKTSTSGAKTTVLTLYPRKLVELASGTSQGGAAGYITVAAGTVTYDDQFSGCLCVATIDSVVEARVLSSCTASNQQCAVVPDWNTTPDADDTYKIYLPEGMQIAPVNVTAIAGNATNAANLGTAASNYSATRGLAGTALPAAASDAPGGLPISDAGGLDLDTQLATLTNGTYGLDKLSRPGTAQTITANQAVNAAQWGGAALPTFPTWPALWDWAKAGDAMALTSGERTTLAAAIEAAIINELDGQAVMQAIADLIASDMNTTDLTVQAIAAAVRDAILNRVLAGNHDTAGTAGKLLQNADVATSTRHAAGAAVAKSPATLDWSADVTNKPTIGTSTLQASDILATPANKLATNASGYVTTTNPGTGATAEQVRVEMDSNSTKLASILEDTGTTLPAAIAALDVGSGTGAIPVTITVVVDGTTDPIDGATVSLWQGGTLCASLPTDEHGQVVLNVEAGDYTVAISSRGLYQFGGDSLTVAVGMTMPTYEMTALAITPPANPDDCACAWLCLDSSDQPTAGVVISARPHTDATGDGIAWSGKIRTATSVAGTGLAVLNLPKGSKWYVRAGTGQEKLYIVPSDDTDQAGSVRGAKLDAK